MSIFINAIYFFDSLGADSISTLFHSKQILDKDKIYDIIPIEIRYKKIHGKNSYRDVMLCRNFFIINKKSESTKLNVNCDFSLSKKYFMT